MRYSNFSSPLTSSNHTSPCFKSFSQLLTSGALPEFSSRMCTSGPCPQSFPRLFSSVSSFGSSLTTSPTSSPLVLSQVLCPKPHLWSFLWVFLLDIFLWFFTRNHLLHRSLWFFPQPYLHSSFSKFTNPGPPLESFSRTLLSNPSL